MVTKFARYLVISLVLGSPIATLATYGDTTTWVSQVYWGDGYNRAEMYLDFPEDITHDSAGNFFIADTYNNVIRKIDTAGTASTVYGTGSYGSGTGELAYPAGVAINSAGDLFVADKDNNAIEKIQAGTATVLANNLNKPEGVALYGNAVLFLDTGNNALKKVASTGGNVTTIVSDLNAPKKLTIIDNSAYIANSGSYQIVQVNLTTGTKSVLAGTGVSGNKDGTCTEAKFNNIWGITSNGSDKLFVSDGNGFDDYVRQIDLTTCTVSLLASDVNMVSINFPAGLTYLNEQLYVANYGIGTIHRFSVADSNDNEIYAGAERFQNNDAKQLLGRPVAMVKTGQWVYFIENNKIKKINRKTKELHYITASSVDNYREGRPDRARFSSPASLAVNKAGTTLYVADRWNHRIRVVDVATGYVSYLTGAGMINGNGNKNNGYAEGKACLDEFTAAKSGCAYFNQPAGIVLSADEKYLYVADAGNEVIRKVNIATGVTALVAGKPQQSGLVNGVGEAARFNTPWSMVANKDVTKLYITDRDNHVVRRLNLANGKVTTVAGNGLAGYAEGLFSSSRFSYPDTIARRGKKLYVTEAGSQRVRLLDLNLKVTKLVSGSGNIGYRNGTAKQAEFSGPMGMIAGKNKLLVADNRNDQIRIIDVKGVAPYADPAPGITAVNPNENIYTGQSGETKALQVLGSNFRYGTVVYFGSHKANKTYVNSSTELSVVIPFGDMKTGYYQVKIVNPDGQTAKLNRGYGISDNNGAVPIVDYGAK
ncbi:MAG: hypothetical protein WCW27_02315 [Patescibacteria group bacterium]|jgi:sugar lactone lactonase YvrE